MSWISLYIDDWLRDLAFSTQSMCEDGGRNIELVELCPNSECGNSKSIQSVADPPRGEVSPPPNFHEPISAAEVHSGPITFTV